jgi:hypothetical protein
MPGLLTIQSRVVVRHREVFTVTVNITDASRSADYVIRLWQTAGLEPFYMGVKPATTNIDGNGAAVFEVALEGAQGDVVAMLTADDEEGGPLIPDTQTIRVVP